MVPGEWYGGPLYGVRRAGPGEFLVAKFGGRQDPDSTYEVTDRGSSAWRCTCPASRRSYGDCKHARLVRAAERAGEPPALWAADGDSFSPVPWPLEEGDLL